MIAAPARPWPPPPTPDAAVPPRRPEPALGLLVAVGLTGMLLLSPVHFVNLPLNMAPEEVWNLLTMPVYWLFLARMRHALRLPYLVAMWTVVLGSFVGTFAAPTPTFSLIAIVKDLYLYVWFVTLAAVFSALEARQLRRVLYLWAGVVLLHGGLVIGELLSPSLMAAVQSFAARFGGVDAFRPSGLFANANSTAFYQLMGFVPLLMAWPRRHAASILGLAMLASVLATGSMASTLGFFGGWAAATLILCVVGGRLAPTFRAMAAVVIPTLLLVGVAYLALSQNPQVGAEIKSLYLNRVEGSADGRFSIWERGLDSVVTGWHLLGIGPDSYRQIDLIHKQLHNDTLEFLVERGVIGLVGLGLFASTALIKSLDLLLRHRKHPDATWPVVVVFVAAVVGMMIHGEFHQIFHDRAVWFVLAVQEAMIYRTVSRAHELDPWVRPAAPSGALTPSYPDPRPVGRRLGTVAR